MFLRALQDIDMNLEQDVPLELPELLDNPADALKYLTEQSAIDGNTFQLTP